MPLTPGPISLAFFTKIWKKITFLANFFADLRILLKLHKFLTTELAWYTSNLLHSNHFNINQKQNELEFVVEEKNCEWNGSLVCIMPSLDWKCESITFVRIKEHVIHIKPHWWVMIQALMLFTAAMEGEKECYLHYSLATLTHWTMEDAFVVLDESFWSSCQGCISMLYCP